ncbi:MAG TPA: sugar MFS transporter [Bacteriovoracaceae bacterium]|nr:sugar MFS transporter [Bacteriovoracaceae bacterium]
MYRHALIAITVLFFMMGFITCLNDILVPYMKAVFNLGYTQASLVQFCFFGAYGLTSVPASNFIEKVGYQKGMVFGFILAALGCFLFFPAVSFNKYELFLAALFVLAVGIVLLQVAANPYVSILGSKESASSRLTMVQAFNSLGTFIAPFFGSYYILSKLAESKKGPIALGYPYLFIAFTLVIVALLLMKMTFPELTTAKDTEKTSLKEVLRSPGLFMGMLGIFMYVGAEVALGTFLVNYIMDRSSMQETAAANMVAIYWGGAMVGRFLGIYTLKKFLPSKVLTFHALLAIALILISINSYGSTAIYSMILVGVCNSIMFPTIFTLSISKVKDRHVHKASGLLGTAILGGAFMPVITGNIADQVGLRIAFLIPALCYGYIAFFGNRHKV